MEAAKTDDIGGYILLEAIGQGGMGTVYKCKHKELGGEFALKMVHSELVTNESALRKFEQEVKAASQLTHANLAAVYRQGRTAGGFPFLVMDLIRGLSLAQMIEIEGYLGVERCLNIFVQICDALIHAHYKGVIHRDLKPSNIMLAKCEYGGEIVKVLDFGIASVLNGGTAEATDTAGSAGQNSDVCGTPGYMSPEQCLGLPVDARSDIYSLGCIMYETLTGKLPFQGKNAIQIILKHIDDSPAVFRKEFNDLNIPPDLEKVVLGALEKNAASRYQSMEELRSDLLRITESQPIKRRPIISSSSTKKTGPVRLLQAQNLLDKTALLAAVCLLLFISFLSVISTLQSRQATHIEIAAAAAAAAESTAQKVFPLIEIKDINGKSLYRTTSAPGLNDALCAALAEGVNITGANLRGCRLKDMPGGLEHGRLANADFSFAILDKTSFTDCNFTGAKFPHAQITSTFNNCNLTRANFRHTKFKPYAESGSGVDFSDCFLYQADFSNASFLDSHRGVQVYFPVSSDAEETVALNRIYPKNATLNFSHCNLTGADFSHVNSRGMAVYLESIPTTTGVRDQHLQATTDNNFTNAKFVGANLENSSFSDANLTGVDFRRARLDGADLSEAILTKTNFSGAQLRHAFVTNQRLHCIGGDFRMCERLPQRRP